MSERRVFTNKKSWIGLLLVLASVSIFFIMGISQAAPNDECFTCHTSENRTVNQSLYNSNNHSILECIDCHVNSTNGSDLDHGKFIRQLNGSNVSSPKELLSDYSSEKFSLCYFCHAEEKVVGLTGDMRKHMNNFSHVNTSPPIVTSIGSNFINLLFKGNKIDGYYPQNIHWNHLDDYGSSPNGNGGKFDSNHDGLRDSYQSCPACHNVHGTDYPKMTRNSLKINYTFDNDGDYYGYIGDSEDYYNNSNQDYICSPACHSNPGTQYKYYRPEKKLFEDCLSCHTTNMTKDFNITSFGQGIHIDINTTNGTGVVNNSDCWMCHYQKNMKKSKIYTCVDCHVNGTLPEAPRVTSHKPEKTNKTSCEACHDVGKIDPGLNIDGAKVPNVTSHYAIKQIVPTPNYCDYCHGPNPSSAFQAPYRSIISFFHNSSNASFPENTNCRTCHTRTDVTADPLANNNSNFHNMTTEYGDVKNDTKIANCIYCHIDHDTNFSNAPSPSHSTEGMVLDNCYLCHGTKVAGTNKQKLHDVRSFVTTGCIPCHVELNDVNISMFGLHKNLNYTGGTNNMTDDDCKTCHFGSTTGDLPMIPNGANPSNTYDCRACHTISGTGPRKPTDTNLIIDYSRSYTHGKNTCFSCHAPNKYHNRGTLGPRGWVENPGWDLLSPVNYAGCHDCHRTHNGLDEPFHAPGIDPYSSTGKNYHAASNSQQGGSDCQTTCHDSTINPHHVYSKTTHVVQILSAPVLSPSRVFVNGSLNVTTTGSARSSASLQIEAAQYQIKTSPRGVIIVPWKPMNATDGSFSSSLENVNATINTTGLPEGTYIVSARVMASAPPTNGASSYYPLNGDWSAALDATLIIELPRGFINGSVMNTTGSGISNATVTTNTGEYAYTDSTGFYSLNLTVGRYNLTATKDPEFYQNTTISAIEVERSATKIQDFIITEKPKGTIYGTVMNI